MNDTEPKTLMEAVRYFSDPAVCLDYMRQIKWPDGKIVCPKCASDNIGFIATRAACYKCRACKKQFSAKVDTILRRVLSASISGSSLSGSSPTPRMASAAWNFTAA